MAAGTSTPPPLTTAEWVARRLGLSEKSGKLTIYQWARAGKIPSVRLGNLVRFDPERIQAWLDAGGMAGEEE